MEGESKQCTERIRTKGKSMSGFPGKEMLKELKKEKGKRKRDHGGLEPKTYLQKRSVRGLVR
jgi:hypothetical protein